MKICTKCNIEKTLESFSKKKRGKFGVDSRCRPCKNEYNKQHRKDNPITFKRNDEQKLQRNKERLNKYHNDEEYRLKEKIRAGMRRLRKGAKSKRTIEILGCTFEELNKTLGDTAGMHVDHIVPQSLANTEEELMALNHNSNFQLLSSKENMLKGNRYVKNENLVKVLENHPNAELIIRIIENSNIEVI